MAEIVVLGAGLGGVMAAYEIKAKSRGKDRLTLISKGDSYFFVPSNPWVAVSWRDRKSIEVKLPPVMRKKSRAPMISIQSPAASRPTGATAR